MRYPVSTLAISWVFLVVSQVQGAHALRIKSEPELLTPGSQAHHALANETRTGCRGTGALFIHFGLGAHGGESLDTFFRMNEFATVFYNNRNGLPQNEWGSRRFLWEMIADDLRAGNDHLPEIQRTVAEAKQGSACGNVFLGDIKPEKVVFGKYIGPDQIGDIEANESHPTYPQLYRSLEKAFPDAVWIWLIRHPDKWATSLTHWADVQNQEQADRHLQNARGRHAHFHCGASQHFGDRTIGKPDGNVQRHGKGDVVQLNLEQLDWPLFVKQLQDVSGYQGLSSEEHMPHVGHHPSSWTYPAPDADNWNPWDYLTKACEPAAEFASFRSSPWNDDDDEDSGL